MTRFSGRSPLTVAVIAPLRHPLGEPHAGGLEAAVYNRIRLLRSRGHRVLLVGVEGSVPGPSTAALTLPAVRWTEAGATARDTTFPPGHLDRAEVALEGALDWISANAGEIDVIDNHSLHSLPLQRAGSIGVPMLTTLHTPPIAEMLQAAGGGDSRVVAVSGHTARLWEDAGLRPVPVLHNMVDTATWRLGQGGGSLAWFGRIVPEKAPHLAIEAAVEAGLPLALAGRIGDAEYFDAEIRPRLGGDIVHVGELRAREVARLVGRSSAVMATPMWDEPFGLVIAESLATGTPVVAFDRGGVPEVTGSNPGALLVPAGDVTGLAAGAASFARSTTPGLRRAVRADAVRRFSFRRHVVVLEDLLWEVVTDRRDELELRGDQVQRAELGA